MTDKTTTTTTTTDETEMEKSDASLRVLVQLAITTAQLAQQTNDKRVQAIADEAVKQLEGSGGGLQALLASGMVQLASEEQPSRAPSPNRTELYRSPYGDLMQGFTEHNVQQT